MSVALRIVRLPPPEPPPAPAGQRCFSFVPVRVIVRAAPRPSTRRRGPTEAQRWLELLHHAFEWSHPTPIEAYVPPPAVPPLPAVAIPIIEPPRKPAPPRPVPRLPAFPPPRTKPPGPPAPKAPIRTPKLRPYVPRKQRSGPRPRSMGVEELTRAEKAELEHDVAELEAEGVYALRPRTYAECPTGPCPWVRCRHNLYLEVDPFTRAVKVNFPGQEITDLEETCSLRVAERLPIGETMPLKKVGGFLNITLEWTRQLESEASRLLKRRLLQVMRGESWNEG